MKIILLLLLLTAASAYSTLSYTFNANSTSVYAPPSYLLGYLTNGSIISIKIQPFDGSLSGYNLAIKDANNSATIQALTLGSDNSTTWNVSANGTYYLQVSGSSPSSSLRMYYLAATLNYTTTLLRLTDVLRSQIVRYIYWSPSDPPTVTVTVSIANSSVTVYLMGGSQFSVASAVTTTSALVNGITTFTLTSLTTGFYTIVFTVPTTNSVTITFPTSSYACPFSGFNDYYGIFSGCGTTTYNSQPGLPCINYDYVYARCLACVSGYTLSNGFCSQVIPCTSRQYYSFAVCYDVSPSCDNFDRYTGDCLTCVNATQYKLVNGKCIFVGITCPDGSYASGNICIPNTCASAFNNASCVSCISIAYYLNNGTCLPINCGNGLYFSVKFNACASIPVGCAVFSVLTQSCQTCASGYFLNEGVCVQPSGSANCLVWNFKTNVCDQCQPNYSYILNLCQINVSAPISCNPGQFLVNKVCVTLPLNCLALNSYYICTQCASNYQISAGQCVKCDGVNPNFPCVFCPTNYYVSSTGSCVAASQFCKTSNPLSGLCTSCTSGNDPVGGICCPDRQVVQNGVCTTLNSSNNGNGNNGGNLGSKSLVYYEKCLYYSPECDCCRQCRNGYSFDYADHCA